jgi:hypothetical protein
MSVSASDRVLPLTATVIIDADALQIAHDSPSNPPLPLRLPQLNGEMNVIAITIHALCLVRRALGQTPVTRLLVVVEDDLLVERLLSAIETQEQ